MLDPWGGVGITWLREPRVLPTHLTGPVKSFFDLWLEEGHWARASSCKCAKSVMTRTETCAECPTRGEEMVLRW